MVSTNSIAGRAEMLAVESVCSHTATRQRTGGRTGTARANAGQRRHRHWIDVALVVIFTISALDVLSRGATDPRSGETPEIQANDDGTQHWAFQVPREPRIPVAQRDPWVRSPIDALALARIESHGLRPSSDAPREVLIRRLSYDLTGLPPSYEQVQGFLADGSDTAYESLVQRLLSSPHFGERWARFWLDVARFADTKGYVFREDRNYPDAYKYRDWVINSLNNDLPYDRFVVCQLAADRLPPGERDAALPAMGYLTLGRRFINNKHDIIDDRIDVVTRGLIGLTVTCARCHDHKYDPIPTEDYYSLYGVFDNSRESKDVSPLCLVDVERPRDAAILVRGNPRNRGPRVPRRFLQVLAGDDRQPFTDGSGRLELARAIANPDNPLTARVMVNRVWQHLFGEGLVRTPSDFGRRSDPPAQPEVLDYLAVEFVNDGWSIKRLIRRIVCSSLYRQDSRQRQDILDADPDNLLLAKANPRRLDFEAMRDSLLAASGRLDRTVGGPSVQITELPFSPRRTLYGFIDRQNLPSMFRTFDFASPDNHVPQRFQTTVPQQALYLMNSPFMWQLLESLTARLALDGQPPTPQRIDLLYRRVYARDATPDETDLGMQFFQAADDSPRTDENLTAWQRYAQILLLSNEFIFVD